MALLPLLLPFLYTFLLALFLPLNLLLGQEIAPFWVGEVRSAAGEAPVRKLCGKHKRRVQENGKDDEKETGRHYQQEKLSTLMKGGLLLFSLVKKCELGRRGFILAVELETAVE